MIDVSMPRFFPVFAVLSTTTQFQEDQMNKKVLIGAGAVYVAMAILGFLIHDVMLGSTYREESMLHLWRTPEEMMMGVIFVSNLIVAFFLSVVFSKGYQGKGLSEGVRFGFYMGMIIATPMAYATYATMPITYSLALQWFIYGIIEYLIYGIILALVFGMKGSSSQ